MEAVIYVCFLLPALYDMVYGVRFVEQPIGVTIVEGETFILRCIVENKGTDNVFWKTMDSSIIISLDTEIDPYNTFTAGKQGRYSIIGDHESGEYNLQIVNASLEDSGRYSCLYYTNFNHYSRIAKVRIMVPPDAGYPKCSVHPHGATAGDTVRLTCRSSGGDPPATLAWVSGTRILRMYMPQNPNPINEVSYTLTDEDLNKVFTCAATTPAIEQPLLSCNVVAYRKKIFVFVEPVVNRVMAGEYANFHCISPKKSGTIRWVIGSTIVDPSDSRFTITRKGKRLRILQTVRSEHDNMLVSCQIMDRIGVAGNGSSVLVVNAWETTTQFATTDISTEIIAIIESDIGVVPPVTTDSVSTRMRTVPLVTEDSPLEKSAIRHAKNSPSSAVTTSTVTTTPLVPMVTKTPLVSTTRDATTAQHSIDYTTTNTVSAYKTTSLQMGITELSTASMDTPTRTQSSTGDTNVSSQSMQTMTTKQMYLTTESVQSTRSLKKSTIAFDTLPYAPSNTQTTRLMSSTVSMEIKTDGKTHSTERIIVHDMNDGADISNDIVGKSTNVLIGGLVGFVILIIIIIVLSIIYIKRRRETTEIKAV